MNEKVSPFDFVEAVSQTKVDIISKADDPEWMARQYNAFMTNKALSYYPDTILHANEMNKLYNLYPDAAFRYYLNILRPRKRRSKWYKSEKSEIIDAICSKYGVNKQRAREYNALLNDKQREDIMKSRNKGGASK